MKILALTPCLMLPNTRDINKKSITSNYELFNFDGYAIYDQCFEESDYDSRFTYIGHVKERQGWVIPRNALLKYFYESDYDYAFWIDANSTVSKPTVNDLNTIIDAIHNNKLNDVDVIFSTLGMWHARERISQKSASDHLDNVHLVPIKYDKSYNWMHGLFHKNYKKYYNQEFYIDTRCDTLIGIPEDVYFSRLIRRFSNAYLAPTIVINKPTSRQSTTWANKEGSYNYPPVKFDVVDKYIRESTDNNNYRHVNMLADRKEIILPRLDDSYKQFVSPYKPRVVEPTQFPSAKKITLF